LSPPARGIGLLIYAHYHNKYVEYFGVFVCHANVLRHLFRHGIIFPHFVPPPPPFGQRRIDLE